MSGALLAAAEVPARRAAPEGRGGVAASCACCRVSSIELESICGTDSPWSDPCRAVWVGPRPRPGSGADADTLRRACGQSADTNRNGTINETGEPITSGGLDDNGRV